MSHFFWLLFVDTHDLQQLFAGVDVPFDCEFLVAQLQGGHVVLTEVYRISPKHPLHKYSFGNWTRSGGLRGPTGGLYQRRDNLEGLTLRTSFQHDKWTPESLQRETRSTPSAIFMAMWKKLEKEMNFKTEYHVCEDGYYGLQSKNGSWTGVIGMLQRNEVDVANSDASMSSTRLDVVDFTFPVLLGRYHFIIKETEAFQLKYETFLLPFEWSLWTAVLFTVILLIISITAINYSKKRLLSNESEEDYTLISASLLIVGVFCQQGSYNPPKTTTLRVIFLTSYLTAMVLFASYSASFISYLTLRNPTLPFADFEGFYRDGSYKLSLVKGSEDAEYFKNSTNEMLKQIYKEYIAPYWDNLSASDREGLHKVCTEAKVAHFIIHFGKLMYHATPNCSTVLIPNAFVPVFIAIPIAKGSPYLGLFTHKLREMRREGHLAAWNKLDKEQWDATDTPENSIKINDVMPILGIIVVGTTISLLIFIIEFCIKTFSSKFRRAAKY